MSNANHIGDLNEMVDIFVGDNDHGDVLPEPKCGSCGVPWLDHMGIMGVCADNKALREDLMAALESHDEMRLEIAQLRKERDEARQEYCEYRYPMVSTGEDHEATERKRGWDCSNCYKENTQAMNKIAKLDEELGL
jgi:hypothetical protein